jgi:hypothetical protein
MPAFDQLLKEIERLEYQGLTTSDAFAQIIAQYGLTAEQADKLFLEREALDDRTRRLRQD